MSSVTFICDETELIFETTPSSFVKAKSYHCCLIFPIVGINVITSKFGMNENKWGAPFVPLGRFVVPEHVLVWDFARDAYEFFF
jgi:hypothetical protein